MSKISLPGTTEWENYDKKRVKRQRGNGKDKNINEKKKKKTEKKNNEDDNKDKKKQTRNEVKNKKEKKKSKKREMKKKQKKNKKKERKKRDNKKEKLVNSCHLMYGLMNFYGLYEVFLVGSNLNR